MFFDRYFEDAEFDKIARLDPFPATHPATIQKCSIAGSEIAELIPTVFRTGNFGVVSRNIRFFYSQIVIMPSPNTVFGILEDQFEYVPVDVGGYYKLQCHALCREILRLKIKIYQTFVY
jgi:hypothetical protein